jgi:hypothetical protein
MAGEQDSVMLKRDISVRIIPFLIIISTIFCLSRIIVHEFISAQTYINLILTDFVLFILALICFVFSNKIIHDQSLKSDYFTLGINFLVEALLYILALPRFKVYRYQMPFYSWDILALFALPIFIIMLEIKILMHRSSSTRH